MSESKIDPIIGDKINERIVWIDCEMTGLDLEKDALIEIAVIVTDADLNPLGEGVDIIIKPPTGFTMSEFVTNMHTESGLIKELESGTSLEAAQTEVMAYITTWIPEARKAPLAGNSVGMDRLFIARDLPLLDAHLHYRIIDVSSIKEIARRWFPRTYFASPKKSGNHRALGDIQDSLNELRYYREAIFAPRPGLESDRAKSIAEKYEKPTS